MATNQQSETNQSRDGEPLRPTFTAGRFLAEQGLEPGLPTGGEWHWIGDDVTLSKFGAVEGQTVDADAYNRVHGGRSVHTGDVVRKATTLPRNLGPTKGVSTEQEGFMRGLVQLEGSLGAPEAVAERYRGATPAEQEEIKKLLLKETRTGISWVTGARRLAAAATVTEVGEGAEATIKVDWVAFGADRDHRIASPYDDKCIKAVDTFTRESAGRIRAALERARAAEVAAEAKAAPQTAAAPQAEVSAPQSSSSTLPLSGPLTLPEKPLTDSLHAARVGGQLRDEAARDIWRRGRAAARSADLGQLSEQELRDGLPAENPFAKLPESSGDKAALSAWWKDHGEAGVRTVAIEGQLIDNARRAYEDLAKRESERRGKVSPYPMGKIRRVRDAQFANGVENDAAILASRMGSMPQQERQDRTAELKAKIRPVGFEKADREDLAKWVALQHGRNVDKAHAAQREAAAIPEVAPTPELIAAESGRESGIV